jgi:UDP-2,3-diacylglucosamine pyrophosphatase LpxH
MTHLKIIQPLPAHTKLMYLIQNLSYFSTFTTQHHVLGKQNSQHYMTLQTLKKYVCKSYVAIKNVTARGGGREQMTGVTNIYIHTHTHSLHINNPSCEDTMTYIYTQNPPK